ncbi:hypothetical protein HDV02_006263 [Globomyces sp. JEL0801]|nr:hypothetical protein HDV02_006263 [Globomyces sp. JEL0801]
MSIVSFPYKRVTECKKETKSLPMKPSKLQYYWPSRYKQFHLIEKWNLLFKNPIFYQKALQNYLNSSHIGLEKQFPKLKLKKYLKIDAPTIVDTISDFPSDLLPLDPMMTVESIFEQSGYIFPVNTIMDFDVQNEDGSIIPMRMQRWNPSHTLRSEHVFTVRHRITLEPIYQPTKPTCLLKQNRPLKRSASMDDILPKPNIPERFLDDISRPSKKRKTGQMIPGARMLSEPEPLEKSPIVDQSFEPMFKAISSTTVHQYPLPLPIHIRQQFRVALLEKAFRGSEWDRLPIELLLMIAKYDLADIFEDQLTCI